MISIFQGHTLFSWINLYVGKNYHSRRKRFLPMGKNEAVDQWGENKNLCYFDVNCWWSSFVETLMIIFQYAIHLTPESTGNSARLLFHHHLSLFLKKHLYSTVIFINLLRSLCWEARTFCYSHFTDKVRDKREMTCYEYFSKLLGLKISNLLLSLWNFPINWVVLPLSKSVYRILRRAVCLEFGFNISAMHHPVPVKSLLACFVFFVFLSFWDYILKARKEENVPEFHFLTLSKDEAVFFFSFCKLKKEAP